MAPPTLCSVMYSTVQYTYWGVISLRSHCNLGYSNPSVGCPIHRKKRFMSFPSPGGMSLTKLPLGRNNSVLTSLFPPRESLIVTSRLGTGNSRTFFLRCSLWTHCLYIKPATPCNCLTGKHKYDNRNFSMILSGLSTPLVLYCGSLSQ